MFGLNIPLPDFWIVYFFAFWVLVGATTAPVTFRHKGHHPLLGVLIGVGVSVIIGFVFMLLLVVLDPVVDVLDSPFIGTLLSVVVSAVLIVVVLNFLRRYVPDAAGEREEGQALSGPRTPVAYSTRVDKVDPAWMSAQSIRASVVVMLAVLTLIPVIWMGMTAFKSRSDAVTKRRQLTDAQKQE
jgi:hypothetical protein